MIVPVHLGDNQIGTTCLPWQKYVGPLPVRRQDVGLTTFGVEMVKAMNDLGVVIDGSQRTFLLEKGRENIIDAGLRNGIELPFSCKGGVCSTCRCRLVDGEVDMDVNFALEDYELARGFVLCCQSYPATDAVTVDFDQTA